MTAYLTKSGDGTKVLTLVNKMAETKAECKITIPGFKGNATIKEYTKENMTRGLDSQKKVLKGADKITIQPYSSIAIILK